MCEYKGGRAVATFIAAGAGFVAMVALGATVYYLLALVVVPLAAADIWRKVQASTKTRFCL